MSDKYHILKNLKKKLKQSTQVFYILKNAIIQRDKLKFQRQVEKAYRLVESEYQAKVINEFASKYGLSIFNLDGNDNGDDMDDGFWLLIKQAFKVTRAKPTKFSEIKQLFISLVKAATSKDIITSKQSKSKKDRDTTVYTLNESLLKHHLELNSLKNKTCKGFSQEVVDKFELAVDDDHFLDCDMSMLDN